MRLKKLLEDMTIPNLRRGEVPVSKSMIPTRTNKFEKDAPNPEKEDAAVRGGQYKTNKIIRKNAKKNQNSR